MKLSIRKFLLFNLLLTIIVTTTLSAIGNYYLDQQEIHKNQDNLLSQATFAFQAFLDGNDAKVVQVKHIQQQLNAIPNQIKQFINADSIDKESIIENDNRYQFQLWNNQNKLLLHSPNSPRESLAGQLGLSDKTIKGETWRVFTLYDVNKKLTFVVAEHYDMRNSLAKRIMKDDIYIMLLVYPFSGLLIWFIIGRGLQSIQRVTKEMAERAADKLDPVDVEDVPTEIKPLIDELNKLFLRLKQAFEREQRFAADAAHELRTPLAALKTQAQVALRSANMQERQSHLKQVIAGVDRCTHIIQQLLTLCRMGDESITLENPTDIELEKLAAEVISQIAPSAIDKSIDIELITKGKSFTLIGNATGLYALIRNLVDNAVRYTPEGGQVKITLLEKNHYISIKVIDNGPGIPAELRSRVFERFFRILGNKAQGSGLGLAIVLQISKLHHGNVTLGTPENGKGLEVEVEFPKKLIS